MNCQEVIEFMQRYIDEDLNQQEKKLMMDHIGQCPDCATMLIKLQKLSSELTQLPRVIPRYSLVDAILPELERLRAAESTETSNSNESVTSVTAAATLRSNRPRRHLFRNLSGIIAAAVVAGLLLFNLPQNGAFIDGGNSNDAAQAPMSDMAASESSSMLKKDMKGSSNTSEMGATTNSTFNDENNADSAIPAPDKPTMPTRTLDTTSKLTPQDEIPEEQPSMKEPAAEQEISPDRSTNSAAPAELFALEDPNGPEEEELSAREDDAEKSLSTMDQPSAEAPKIKDLNSAAFTMSGTDSTVAAEASISPDGRWRAIAITGEGTIQVYKTEDDSQLFISEFREGIISLLSWNEENSLLYYTHTSVDGHQTQYVYDVINGQESIR